MFAHYLVGRGTRLASNSLVTQQRTMQTASTRRPSKSSFSKAIAAPSLALLALGYCTTTSTLYAESSSSTVRSASSTVFRPADPAAYRRPPTALLFMSYDQEHKKEWQDWIGYFRQAGYDCIDMNVVLEGDDHVNLLSEELGSQVRLLSLARAPLLFAYSGQGARLALEHIQSKAPQVGGLVLVTPKGSDQSALQSVQKLDKERLNILLLDGEEDEQALRETERWMDRQGLS